MVFGIGGGSSKSRSESSQQVWDVQAGFLRDFWPLVENMFREQNDRIFEYGMGLSEEVSGRIDRAGSAYEAILSGEDPGSAYLQGRLSEGNPYLEGAISDYGADIARNLAENILPELRSGGVAAGAPGGSRAYIAQGMAAEGAQREFARGANQMRLADLAQTDALAGQYAGQQMMAASGLAGLAEPAYNLGMAPYSAAWMPALNYANVLGPPTVLSESEGKSDEWNFSI